MFTLHNKILKQAGGLFVPLCLAAAFCAGTTMNVHAQPAPSNDNLANAQGISGSIGTISGPNLYATNQTGEPTPDGAGASIWYVWTAPITTTIDFSTRGSTDPVTGDPLDTVLAVYTLTSGTNVTYANLTQVALNDDDPSGGVTSRVDFPVTVGQTYYIQALGSPNNPTGTYAYAEGNIELSWSSSLVGGTFGFSAPNYFAGEFDDYILVSYEPNSIDQSLANKSGDPNVRITVTRQGGFTGKCQVTFSLTNVTYTNLFQTNYTGTNFYITNYNTDTNGNILSVASFTNTFYTNIASENIFTNYIGNESFNEFVGQPVWNVFAVTQTNNNGTLTPLMTNLVPLTGLGLTNFFTNWPCLNQTTLTSNSTGTSNLTITITQIFCIGPISTNTVTPSASNGLDYTALTTNLVFDDFQMSKNVYVQVNPTGSALLGPDFPDSNGYYNYFGMNSLVLMTLSNPTNVSGENPDITPPTLSTSSAYLDILNFYNDPNNYIGSPSYLVTNNPLQEVTVNLERASFRCNRVPNGSNPGLGTNAFLYLVLAGNYPSTATYTFHYTIDCSSVATPGVVGLPISAFDWDRFPTVASSDYAVPSYYTNGGVAFPDFGLPVNTPPDPIPIVVGKNTAFPSGAPYVGSITIGPFNPGQPYGLIAIPILTNGAVEFDEDMIVELFETTGDESANRAVTAANGQPAPGFLGNISSAHLTIEFTGQPGGAYDTSFNIDNTPTSSPPQNTQPGASGGSVNAIAIQPNGQAVIGGYFNSYDDQVVYGIARLFTDGFLDTNFNKNIKNPGVAAGGYVLATAIDASGRIIIGGSFQSYNGISVQNIARLNYNGSLDTTFNSGIGFNGSVNALALDTNGDILVGGDFTSYNTTNCNYIARLMTNGGLDPTFLPNTGNGLNYGTDQAVETVATDGNGNVIIGGQFGSVNGNYLSYLARLLPTGAVDPSFNPGIGPDNYVYSVAIEPNNEILIGGAFQTYDLISSPGVALIATNGSLDTTFVPGSGADGIVHSVSLQPNGDVLVGGQFRNFNTSRRLGVARLLPNGWVDTSFMDTAYNQYAGLINKAYSDPVNIAYALALQSDTNILVGGSFTNIGGGNARDAIHSQINITRLIGAPTPGPMTSGGGLGNCPGNITFTQNPYSVLDTAGKLFVTLDRVNGSLGPAQVTLGTNLLAPGPGDATAADLGLILPSMPFYGEVYSQWTILPPGQYGWRQGDGYYGFNNTIQPITDFGNSGLSLNIFNDPAAGQNLIADLSLLNLNSQGLLVLGGVSIPTCPALGLPGTELEILNNNINPGVVGFSASNYMAINTSNKVTLTVLRTNGSSGPINLQYYTANGSAISTNNYTGVAAGKGTPLSFSGGTAGNTSQSFTIPIALQSIVQPTTKFFVYLTNASVSGSYSSGIINTNFPPPVYPSATVTILDGNFAPGHLSFSAPTFSVLKGGLATVSVMRSGGGQGQLSVECGTSNGTGTNGINYTAVANTLTWGVGDVSAKTMTIQTLQDNTVDGLKTVNLSLFNASNTVNTNNNNLILTSPSNAVLDINEINSFGGLSFVAPNFNIFQNSGQALITVIRTNGTTGTISVGYTNFSDINAANLGPSYKPAQPGTNFGVTNGTLTFQPGQTSAHFVVPIYYTPGESNAANRVVSLELFNGSPGITSRLPIFATLTILDPQLVNQPPGSVDPGTANEIGTGFNNIVDSLALQPDGSVLAGGAFTSVDNYPFDDVTRLLPNGHYDSDFLGTASGGTVFQVLSQNPISSASNGPIIIAGNFTNVNGVGANGITRLNVNGSIDETFNTGSGADGTIYAIAETSLPTAVSNQFSLAYYVGGSFANFGGVPSGGITRLNASTNSPGLPGSIDPNFNVVQGATSADAVIHALAVQANGQVIVGGDFTAFNSIAYNHLIRLNVDGSIDPSFVPNTNFGPADSVRAIAIQPDGQVLIGGLFTNVGGSNLNYLARLNGTDGSVDTGFNVGVGGDGPVLALALDSQSRILVGGEFTRFSGVTRSGITRLNADGTVDPTINFGSGADGGFVDTIVTDSNDEIDVGGGFSSFEGIPEHNFVRLFGLSTYGDGNFEFSQQGYGVLQSGSNAVITIQRIGAEGTNAQTTVNVVFSTSNGSPLAGFEPGQAGVDYTGVTNTLTFPLGESFETVAIPILNNFAVGSNKNVNLNLSDASPTNAGIGIGPIASAILYITNVNSAVSFSAPSYGQSESASSGNASIPVVRIGNPNSTVGVTVYTGTSGTATPNVHYTPVTNTLIFNPGVTSLDFNIPMLGASNLFSYVTVDLEMSNPSNTFIGSPSSAILTISGNSGPGVVSFSQPGYSIVAPASGQTNAIITIVESEILSNTVGVTFTTSNGTAVAGLEYGSVSQPAVFSAQSNVFVYIPVYAQPNAGPATTVLLTLSNPSNGATIGGAAQEILTILNGIESFTFTNSPYTVGESNGTITLQIVRNGPMANAASVNYNTFSPPNTTEAEGYAQPNVDYVPASGTLNFAPNETFTTIPITIIQGNAVNGPLTFQVLLSAPLPLGVQVGPTSVASVTINSDVTGFELSANSYAVGENGSNIVITVNRLNPGTGVASVQYATVNGSALSNVDYASTSGTLTFQNNQATASFTVPILNQNIVESNKTFNVTLSNPLVLTLPNPSTNAYLLSPSNATVTITNVLAGVSFESPTYTVSECGVTAAIPVVLTGATNNPVSINYNTTTNGGSATVGVNYLATNGTLTFSNGQTVQTIYVQVFNNHIIGPNHTVFLALSNPTNALLLNPSTAVLTIQECNGAYIVNSGTAFVSGSVSNSSGVIFSNETVTILFGLRDIAGSNTANLVATLLATNGVTNVSAPQTYGVLITNGPTVARPFTFKAVGTNGQNISANLALQDGSQVYSNVDFGFTLGGLTTTFSTNETLLLVGSNNPPSKASSTNAPNYGYPSVINVSGLVGVVTAVTAGITNFGHTYPSDVAVVLQSPAAPGQGTVLMDDCGGTNSVKNVNLTFSQSASGPLPKSLALSNGTYLPTDYGVVELPATMFWSKIGANELLDKPVHFYWTVAQWILVALCGG